MNAQNIELIDGLMDEIRLNPDYVTDRLREICGIFVSSAAELPQNECEELEKTLEEIAAQSGWQDAVFLLSTGFALRHSESAEHAFLKYLYENNEKISANALYYIYGQCSGYVFRFPETQTLENRTLLWKIFDKVTERFEQYMAGLLEPIPKEERDSDFVIVLTEQFLSFKHGPSKSAADRCKILMEKMGKKVFLINTSEGTCAEGVMLYEFTWGNYVPRFLEQDHVDWKGCRIPFFQCENNMPDLENIRAILQVIQRKKPAFLITIGGGGITGALGAKIVPALSIGMMPSDLVVTGIRYQTLGRNITERDVSLLRNAGRSENDIIIGKFGSSLLEQGQKLTREEAGLPVEGFFICLVGARLELELTDEFWNMAEQVLDGDTFMVILGSFGDQEKEKLKKKHPKVMEHLCFMGFVSDIMSYVELCDLYVNPVRRGGGTSCVEAMFQGLPVVTTAFGDVSVNAGETFWTESYDTMPELIRRYKTDREFYQKQSEAAKNRAEELTDHDGAFIQMIEEFFKKADDSWGEM